MYGEVNTGISQRHKEHKIMRHTTFSEFDLRSTVSHSPYHLIFPALHILKKHYKKALQKLTLKPVKLNLKLTLKTSNPVPFNGQIIKNKRGLELVISCSSGYKTSSEIFLY